VPSRVRASPQGTGARRTRAGCTASRVSTENNPKSRPWKTQLGGGFAPELFPCFAERPPPAAGAAPGEQWWRKANMRPRSAVADGSAYLYSAGRQPRPNWPLPAARQPCGSADDLAALQRQEDFAVVDHTRGNTAVVPAPDGHSLARPERERLVL